MVIPFLANQDLTPMIFIAALNHFTLSFIRKHFISNLNVDGRNA